MKIIRPGTAVDRLVRRVPHKRIIGICRDLDPGQRLRQQIRVGPDAPSVKSDFLDHPRRVRANPLQGDPCVGAGHAQDQVVAGRGDGKITLYEPRNLDRIQTVRVRQRHGAVPRRIAVDIIARAAIQKVTTRTPVQRVVAPLTAQRIGSGLAGQQVVAVPTRNAVIPSTRGDGVAQLAANNDLSGCVPRLRARAEVGICPDRGIIGKTDAFDRAGAVGQRPVQNYATAIGETQFQRDAARQDLHIVRRDRRGKDQLVHPGHVDDPVRPVTKRIEIGIVARLVPQLVSARATGHRVVARPARQRIPARETGNQVIARQPVQRIVKRRPCDGVIRHRRIDDQSGRFRRHPQKLCVGPDSAICKADFGNIPPKPAILDCQPILAADHLQDKIIRSRHRLDQQIAGCDAGVEDHHIVVETSPVVEDAVLSEPGGEEEGVIIATAAQFIVAGPAVQRVAAVPGV